MALHSLEVLDQYKKGGFGHGYPADLKTFYSPVDDVHRVLKDLLASAQRSLIIAMFGFDDDELAQIILDKLKDPHILVQLTLDRSQTKTAHETAILAHAHFPSNSIAIGNSEGGAIMHLKMGVIDGTDVFSGSTNWSTSGQTKQDNELTVHRNAVRAAEARDRIHMIHAHMLAVHK